MSKLTLDQGIDGLIKTIQGIEKRLKQEKDFYKFEKLFEYLSGIRFSLLVLSSVTGENLLDKIKSKKWANSLRNSLLSGGE